MVYETFTITLPVDDERRTKLGNILFPMGIYDKGKWPDSSLPFGDNISVTIWTGEQNAPTIS